MTQPTSSSINLTSEEVLSRITEGVVDPDVLAALKEVQSLPQEWGVSPDLVVEQLKVELESRAKGVERYLKGTKDLDVASTRPGAALITQVIKPLSEAVRIWHAGEDLTGGRSVGKHRHLVSHLEGFENDWPAVAYIVCRTCVESLSMEFDLTSLCMLVSHRLETELLFRHFNTQAPGLAHVVAERRFSRAAPGTKGDRHCRAVAKDIFRTYAIEPFPRWTSEVKATIGRIMVELWCDITQHGTIQTYWQRGKTNKKVVGTEQALAFLAHQHERCSLSQPWLLPMVMPPRPWTAPDRGGYILGNALNGYSVVKTMQRTHGFIGELHHHDLQQVYDALNLLQSTSYRINRVVHQTMQALWDAGESVPGTPSNDPEPLPPKPARMDEDVEVQRAWRQQAAVVHERNNRSRSKRFSHLSKLWVADRFAQYPAIYFVWSLDWRGRAYPMGGHVNPQGDDAGRALLEFASGKPLGPDGAAWLKVALAGCFGVDKVPYHERIEWVDAHWDHVLQSGMSPLAGDRWWSRAEKPWQALALCAELVGWSVMGDEFVSHLPVSVDGSCNGLQHFSAVGLDEAGGRAVNLLPADRPQDIYSVVARRVAEMVEQDAASGSETAPLAAQWVGKVTRAIVKQPTMTKPYGSTRSGMQDQIRDAVAKYDLKHPASPLFPDDAPHKALCGYLAGVTYRAIGEVVIGAQTSMDWLQQATRVLSRTDQPIQWTTPVGWVVQQSYPKWEPIRVELRLRTVKHRINLRTPGGKLDARRQAQAIAPNFVHSLDAAHMMRSVVAARQEGVTHFAMVHDSYGTHAGDLSMLATVLREQFVLMYHELWEQGGPLVDWLEQASTWTPAEDLADIPPVPSPGTLDLSQVLESPYFFA